VISLICKEIAKLYENKDIDAVVSPAIGGIILSQWTAYYLSEFIKKDVLAIYTEKDEDKNQIFTRGYSDLVFNKRILVVEDVITTGSSVIKTIQSIKKASGIVVAVCALVNRDPDHINSKKINFPFQSMADYKMESWEEKDCPLCIKGIKINTSVGHGKKYLENKGIKP
jgi:orotate phosphoribosyltransferase